MAVSFLQIGNKINSSLNINRVKSSDIDIEFKDQRGQKGYIITFNTREGENKIDVIKQDLHLMLGQEVDISDYRNTIVINIPNDYQESITDKELSKQDIKEGNNPYNTDNFWIVYSDSRGKEYVLDGFSTEREAISSIPLWLKDYPNAKVVDYDPMFLESASHLVLKKDYIIEGRVVKAGTRLESRNRKLTERVSSIIDNKEFISLLDLAYGEAKDVLIEKYFDDKARQKGLDADLIWDKSGEESASIVDEIINENMDEFLSIFSNFVIEKLLVDTKEALFKEFKNRTGLNMNSFILDIFKDSLIKTVNIL